MSPIACSLAALLVLETAPAGSSECPLTDNRCKAERFMQRAATAASSASCNGTRRGVAVEVPSAASV